MAINLAKWILSADDQTKAAFESVGKNLKKTDNDILAFAKRTAGYFGLAFGAREILTNIATVERLKASLTSVTGSVETAAQKFEELQEFAGKTPFTLDEIVRGFNKMSVLGLNPTIADMTALGNTASAMGKSLEQFIDAVADAGTNQFERLNEFGIKAKQSADSVEFTFGGVTTKVGKNAKEIVGYLTGIGETRFAGAMELQANTLGGAFSQLGNKAIALSEAIGDAGLTRVVLGLASATGILADGLANATNAMSGAWNQAVENFKAGGINNNIFGGLAAESEGFRNKIDRLLDDLRELKKEYAQTQIDAPEFDFSAAAWSARSRGVELKQEMEKIETEIERYNQMLLKNERVSAGLAARQAQRDRAAQPKTQAESAAQIEAPKVSESFKAFMNDFKTNEQIVSEFTERVIFLNEKFNELGGKGISAERYTDAIKKISGDVEKLGVQSPEIKVALKVKSDREAVKEFSDQVAILSKKFNSLGNDAISAERYTDEIKKISTEIEKIGVQSIDVKMRIATDDEVAKDFTEKMADLNKQFNAEDISIERYVDAIQSISTEVEKIGVRSPEIELKFKTDADMLKPVIADIQALHQMFMDGTIGVNRYEYEIGRVANSLQGLGSNEEELNRQRERAKSIIESLRTPMDAYSADIIEIEQLWRNNIITLEQYYALVEQRSSQFVEKQKEKSSEWEKHWGSAFDRFSGGVGDAVADAMFEQEKFSDVMRGVVKGVLKQVVSGLVEIGIKKVALAAIEKTALGSHTVASKTAAALTATSWAPAAAAVSLATLGGNSVPASAGLAATFALSTGLALAGQAHDGLDMVPRDGTYLLEKGERVVKKEDNQDLKKLLKSGSAGGYAININTTINASGSGAANDIRALIPLIESTSVAAVQRAMHERGRRGVLG